MSRAPVVIFSSLCLLFFTLSCAGDVKSRSCGDVREAYAVKGFSLHDVPHQEIPGDGLPFILLGSREEFSLVCLFKCNYLVGSRSFSCRTSCLSLASLRLVVLCIMVQGGSTLALHVINGNVSVSFRKHPS